MLACLGSMVYLYGTPAAVAQDTGEQPLRIAGLLDKLMDPNSKESQILQGVGSILGSTSELDYKSERTIGESLALEGFRRYGMPVKDADLQKYINLVGNAVARNSLRPGIPYTFVAVDNPLQNAFSCPGGIIFISSGLLKTIGDEAQLAGILAHEVAHVGHKHALQSIQRARFFQGVGKITSATMKGEKGKEFENMIGSLQETLFDKGLDQNMEFEADRSAMETAFRTGYDPEGIIEVLRGLKKIEAQSQKQGSWFSTHPPLGDRIRRCEAEMGRYPDAKSLARLPARYNSLSIGQQPQQGKTEKTKP
jgi:predicted Zn-dependent protease